MRSLRSLCHHPAAAIALAVATIAAALLPAAAGTAIYGGGSTLFSRVFRELADCYHGVQPDGAAPRTAACAAPGYANANVEALYAGVNSGGWSWPGFQLGGTGAFLSNDPRQLLNGGFARFGSRPTLFDLYTPSSLPLYLDSTGLVPKAYPYPRIDFGASAAPLYLRYRDEGSLFFVALTAFSPATGWENLQAGFPLVTALRPPPPPPPYTSYDFAKLGEVIQIPVAEVGVAIVVNAPRPGEVRAPWQITYQGNYTMHLSQAQLCAIFSATVTDWGDLWTEIAYRDSSNQLQYERFNAGNTPTTGYPYTTPYTSSPLPIRVVYDAGASDTTFILTNFLSAVCPYFDDGNNNLYTRIFGGFGPTSNFSELIDRIKREFPERAAIIDSPTTGWIGRRPNPVAPPSSWNIDRIGDGEVAAQIGNSISNPTFSGRIGYVGNNWARPYSRLANAPFPVAVQNEAQRQAGIHHPSPAAPFIGPTPGAISRAWIGMPVPNNVVDYQGFNFYLYTALVHPRPELGFHLGDQKSRLAVPTAAGAYPIVGATFLDLYSCYRDPTGARVSALTDFLSWLYGGQTSLAFFPAGTPATSTRDAPKFDSQVGSILKSAGAHPLPAPYARRIIDRFITTRFRDSITSFSVPRTKGCRSVTGGGAQ